MDKVKINATIKRAQREREREGGRESACAYVVGVELVDELTGTD